MNPAALSGVIAILRGIRPERVLTAAKLCYEHGIRAIEVPLNSPEPFASIERLVRFRPSDCVVGAGTVLDLDELSRVAGIGVDFAVCPNVDTDVIAAGAAAGLQMLPGFATASEAFAAIRAGATLLKLFPASTYGPAHLKALRAVLPASVRVVPVGGIAPADCAAWLQAGAAGFGFGSELFRPDDDDEVLQQRIAAVMHAYRAACQRLTHSPAGA
ncbi:MAG: 2-dehydro-3-deoxy-6-phosphogalactonate aldolase [Rhodanobacteraceae bacterium]|nr:2-dehydro-3-deoxy-6-phosphogalactonate aldolase [Rhodanobacteraceae bacterium]